MKSFQRWAAILGGVGSILLMPLVTVAYFRSWGAAGAPAWVRPATNALRPLLTASSPAETYQTFGRMFLPIFILFLLAAVSLRTVWSPSLDRMGRRGLMLMVAGLVLNIAGSIGDYWLGYAVLGQPWWGLSFLIGTWIGSIVYLAGSVMVGRNILRTNTISRVLAGLIMAAPVAGILLTFWGIGHVPGAFVFAIGLCWLLIALTYRPEVVHHSRPWLASSFAITASARSMPCAWAICMR